MRRRWIIGLVAFALTAAAAAGMAVALPPLYRAKAVLLIDPPLVPGMGQDDIQAQVEALTLENLSRPRLQALAVHLGLTRDGLTPTRAAEALQRDIEIVHDTAAMGGGKASIAITVNIRGSDAALVAEAANTLATFYVDAERDRLRLRTEALASQIEALGSRLDAEDERVAQIRRSQGEDLPPEVAARMANLEKLNAELGRLRDREQALERHRVVREPLPRGAGTPSTEASASPALADVVPAPPVAPPPPPASLAEEEAELVRLQAELRDLRSRYTDEHPAVVRTKRQIEIVKGHLTRLRSLAAPSRAAERQSRPAATARGRKPPRFRSVVLPEVESELQDLVREERTIEQRIALIERLGLTAPGGIVELSALLPRYDGLRAAYLALLQRYEETRAATGADGQYTPFRVVEEAVPPAQPAGPNRMRLLTVGLVLALFGAGLTVLVAEHLDGSFHSAGDLRRFTRVPVLAVIPRIVTTRDVRRTRLLCVVGVGAVALAAAAVFGATYTFAHGNQGVVRMLVK